MRHWVVQWLTFFDKESLLLIPTSPMEQNMCPPRVSRVMSSSGNLNPSAGCTVLGGQLYLPYSSPRYCQSWGRGANFFLWCSLPVTDSHWGGGPTFSSVLLAGYCQPWGRGANFFLWCSLSVTVSHWGGGPTFSSVLLAGFCQPGGGGGTFSVLLK